MKDKSAPEKLLLHAILVCGSLLFSLPFLWMLSTSFKVPREMSLDRLSIFPAAPTPSSVSPFIDAQEFDAPVIPDAVPEAVWTQAEPALRRQFEKVVDAWAPRLPGMPSDSLPLAISHPSYREEMIEGLFDLVDRRMSDTARQAAGTHARNGNADPSVDVEFEEADIQFGVEAMLTDATRLVDEDALQSVLNACYRRICLGEVRVRTSDYVQHGIHIGTEWIAMTEGTRLTEQLDSGLAAEVAVMDGSSVVTCYRLPLDDSSGIDPAAIDRVYVSYRGDASWSSVVFRVMRDGRIYETEEALHLFERDWLEQELRWKEDASDPLARSVYMRLEPMGMAPPDAPGFAVEMEIRRSGLVDAWIAKLSHNYRRTFREVPYARYLMTSFSLAILNILLAMLSCSLVAYAFARLEWPGRDFLFLLLLATMMLPPQVTMIPFFLVVKYLGWYNTLLPLWVTSAFGVPFFIFLLRQFFKTIPKDLEDAARIDGCGFLGIYWHVMLPLVRPVLATIAIFMFMWTWNNFMGPLIYVNDERLFPLALGLFKFNITSGDNVGLMMAGSFVMTLPVILLFFFAQRYFIQGITLTGTKG